MRRPAKALALFNRARRFESFPLRQIIFFDFYKKICYNIYVRKRKEVYEMFKHLRKLMLENRLARLSTNGKENGRVRGKIIRELRKYN